MRRMIYLAIAACMPMLSPLSMSAEEWDDLSIIQITAEEPHASMMTYPDAGLAIKGDRSHSPWFKSLNGEWTFKWSQNPSERPSGFFKTTFDDSTWGKIPVSSN